MLFQPIATLFFLGLLSFLDVKTHNIKGGGIPSAITSSFMIYSFLFYFMIGYPVVVTGIIGILIAILLYDLKLFSGMADLKVMVAVSFAMPDFFSVLMFGMLLSFLSIFYKLYLSKYIKKKVIPFIPVFLISYMGFMIFYYVI